MPEIKELIEGIAKDHDEFKKVNDERLAKIEQSGHNSAELEEKLDKLNRSMDEAIAMKERLEKLELAGQRDGGVAGGDEHDALHKSGFEAYLRKGDETFDGIDKKAISSTDANGGYAIPTELDRQVYVRLGKQVPMRTVCRVITVGTPDYKKLVSVGGATGEWVGETDTRNTTSTPELKEVTPYMGERSAKPKATATALEDMFFDAEGWLIGELVKEFSEADNAAYTSGDGDKKPRGFLDYTQSESVDGVRTFGQIQKVLSGASATFTADDLLNVVYAMKQAHRANASWMMARLTVAHVRKLKDEVGAYVWQPSLQLGQPNGLFGYPVVESDDMPVMAGDSVSVAFANWQDAYYIVDRVGMNTLRDPYSAKPYVEFYTRRRTGGMLVEDEALKLLVLSV